MALFKSSLHGVHGAIRGSYAFDGGDFGAVGLGGQNVAGFDRVAVFDHSAGATLGGVATHMGARHVQMLAQHLH
jgi:hypothetical protein